MVKLISITPNSEKLLAYMARVSSPNQENPEKDKLIGYLIRNKHWSPFEMIHMTLEIRTSRAIGRQILRHRSFTFQEFSQRYEKFPNFEFYAPRRQDSKNRQNSIDDLPFETDAWFLQAQEQVVNLAHKLYYEALAKGIAKECARFLLPELTETKMYMSGNVRNWIHYLELRTGKETQLEHREIAEDCKKIFIEQFPVISKALNWTCNEEQKNI